MKTEIDSRFELGDDPAATRFHFWAFRVTLLLAYWIAVVGAIGIVKLANWIAQQ